MTIKDIALEDYYGEEWEKRYCWDCVQNDSRLQTRTSMSIGDEMVASIGLVLRSVETDTFHSRQ